MVYDVMCFIFMINWLFFYWFRLEEEVFQLKMMLKNLYGVGVGFYLMMKFKMKLNMELKDLYVENLVIMYQFVVFYDLFEREVCFIRWWEEVNGFFFVYYGSFVENWYFIF